MIFVIRREEKKLLKAFYGPLETNWYALKSIIIRNHAPPRHSFKSLWSICPMRWFQLAFVYRLVTLEKNEIICRVRWNLKF